MQKLQLFIPEPCHENWHQMTPTDQGRFCNACAKVVVDFSMMTDTEVLNYFTSLTHEKVCGRALPDQLNRTISYPKEPKKRLFWYWNYMVMFFMFFGKVNTSKAQGNVKMITTEEFSKKRSANINEALAGRVGGVQIANHRVINGKVTDWDGNPVSFATIKIKDSKTGLSADANGLFSIKVKTNSILVISAAGFTEKQIPAGTNSVVYIVLETATVSGGISFRNVYEDFTLLYKAKETATIKVKDDATGKYLQKAAIKISREGNSDTVFTGKKGTYKIKGIKEDETCFIRVMADGYEANEFVIRSRDIKETKKEWEVFLRKQQISPVRSENAAKTGTETTIRLGGVIAVSKDNQPLYVIDGELWIDKSIDSVNPDDVDNITVLQSSEAMAAFGPQGHNGAIVITTRKTKEISFKEVIVASEFGIIRSCHNTGIVSVAGLKTLQSGKQNNNKATANNSLNLYPNPVQRGAAFNIVFKLKQTGPHQIQISDASGHIVLQKQINVLTKEFTEQLIADIRWSSGVYFISFFDTNNQLISRSSFIFQ